MKNVALISFIFLFSILVVYGIDTTYNFKLNQDADIKIICSDEGRYCNETTLCRLNVYYPNSTVLVNNELMTWSGTYYNYTIPSDKINTLGIYYASVECSNANLNNIEKFYFGVTKTDVLLNDENKVSETRILTILGVSGFIFLVLWIIFYFNKKTIHYLFLFMSVIILDTLIYFCYLIADNNSSIFSNILLYLFIIMLIVTFILVLVMMLDLTIRLFNYARSITKNRSKMEWEDNPIYNDD